MIEFQKVSKKFGDDSQPLDEISFLIDKGSFSFLVGPTGSGKTTIFRLIVRDLIPSMGSIILGDWDLTKLPHSKIPQLRRRVGVIFQDLKLLMDRTVLENVVLPLQFSGADEKEAEAKAKKILEEIGLGDKVDKFPMQLSGGEKQRVAIARALVFDPEIILADEPTGNLDMETSFQIVDLLTEINKRGTTILMATHNEKIIDKLNNPTFVLKDGKIISPSSKSKPVKVDVDEDEEKQEKGKKAKDAS